MVVVTNTENAAAGWRVENMGADFYDGSDAVMAKGQRIKWCSKQPQEVPRNI